MLGELSMVCSSLFSKLSNKFSLNLVEDESHSDFIALRTMIIKTNLNHLRDVTHFTHYENYRLKKLSSFHSNEMNNGKVIPNCLMNKFVLLLYSSLSFDFSFRNVLSQIEDEKLEAEQRLEKMSEEMENVYQIKVKEKLEKLQENKQNVSFLFD